MRERPDKPLVFIGSSLDDLSAFPRDAKSVAGHQLRRVQQGLAPDHWRAMNEVGPGTIEIKIDIGDAYRVFFVATFSEAIYVLHAFQKTSQKTSRGDIAVGRQRYRELLEVRRAKSRREHSD